MGNFAKFATLEVRAGLIRVKKGAFLGPKIDKNDAREKGDFFDG